MILIMQVGVTKDTDRSTSVTEIIKEGEHNFDKRGRTGFFLEPKTAQKLRRCVIDQDTRFTTLGAARVT